MAQRCVHIVNLGSIADLERTVALPINPLRFRPNLVLTGAPAWSELGWIGKTIRVGDAALEVVERTARCAATDVNPATGRRDLDIPATLLRSRGHSDMGIYATVKSAGRIRAGDRVTVV
jgi:hypothetical protein